ncbi:polysaccharide deacetylase family protein [Rheinheimera sp. MMS21-TC3]|uniref:polysaccharide deacetylase family protein n=1 Tax=Rheinheimera sp. MMS21-TC3 TaxID=3072790 RepID=UPI0028C44E9B|nr:polysaccharide deacetylase family protein [Rheinheimera sp. MMS21-TC3]WNO59807.1 polysaccharide deacetylase family protein [Rheinheimera sp. MMS21-TC3]
MLRLSVLFMAFINLTLTTAQAAVVLIYHHVASDTPRVTSVTAEEFHDHLQYLKDHNFKVIGLDVLIQQLQTNQPVADNSVVITFDDSYENNFTTARPILQQFGYPYTLFISPGSIDKQDGPLLNWQQVKQMSDEGVLIANHAMWHEHMAAPEAGETKQAWLERMQQSILDAEAKIKLHTGQSHKWLAYPYGEYSLALEQLVSELGFIGIGQHSGAVGNNTSLTHIPRFPAAGQYADLTQLSQKFRSLAFTITDEHQTDSLIHKANPPTLRLTLKVDDFQPSQLQCYASGQVLTPNWITKNSFSVQASKPLAKGRSRYNCTAPSLSKKGYYYWYSQPWIRLD